MRGSRGWLGDRLARVEGLIGWEASRPTVTGLYEDRGPGGGRPNIDEDVMVKLLVLQRWYGLSDPELEGQVADRVSFQRFLGYPGSPPDCSTVWQFRERLAKTGEDEEAWAELQRQLDERGLRAEGGVVQDASFTHHLSPGGASKPRGDGARTRRSRDGDRSKRKNGSVFGYKLRVESVGPGPRPRQGPGDHVGLRTRRQWDPSKPGEVVYRDKGYFGVRPRGYDATMRRGVRGHPLGVLDRLRNRRISRRRASAERAFAVLCRAVLCCAVPCCAVLCRAVLC